MAAKVGMGAVATGGIVSITSAAVAGRLEAPPAFVAMTLKVYAPDASPEYALGEVQAANASAPVDMEHWKVTPKAGVAANANVGLGLLVGVGGLLVMVTVGPVVARFV